MLMPHEGRGCKRNAASRILQTPADVDVITRPVEDWIEATDGQESRSPHREIASGDVFREPVVEQHMCGRAWCTRDTLGEPGIVGGHHVGTARCNGIRNDERTHK